MRVFERDRHRERERERERVLLLLIPSSLNLLGGFLGGGGGLFRCCWVCLLLFLLLLFCCCFFFFFGGGGVLFWFSFLFEGCCFQTSSRKVLTLKSYCLRLPLFPLPGPTNLGECWLGYMTCPLASAVLLLLPCVDLFAVVVLTVVAAAVVVTIFVVAVNVVAATAAFVFSFVLLLYFRPTSSLILSAPQSL